MTRILIEGVTKRFGETVAVDGVSVEVPSGCLFFLLGPSGCGKTTLLRMIAGFARPTQGRIRFDERDVTDVPPNKRNTGMVFQSYALWPHMTVLDNVAYGLRVRRTPAAERRDRALRALRMVRMEALADRKPAQLSGGEQQRVSLARALVVEPDVLLLDEPLSNLDAALRFEMRGEIRRICRQTEITTIYVTHDQQDALSMGDLVAVLRSGRVMQVGTPHDLYARPRNRFVAGFVGEANFLPATVRDVGARDVTIDTPAGRLRSRASGAPPGLSPGQAVTCSIRPETIALVDGSPAPPAEANLLTGRLRQTVYFGQTAGHEIEVSGGLILKVVQLNPSAETHPKPEVKVTVSPADVVLLPDKSD